MATNDQKKEKPAAIFKEGEARKSGQTKDKLAEMIFSHDFKETKDYAIKNLIVPRLLQVFADTVNSAMNFMFFDRSVSNNSSSTYRNGGNATNVPYASYYQSGNGNNNRNDSVNRNSRHGYRGVLVDTIEQADRAIKTIINYSEGYGNQATVADLYEICQLSTSDFTDNAYGWTTDMLKKGRPTYIVKEKMYLIDLPDPIPLSRG